jgi:ribosomal protein S18 acetylase RimI-like enzyme
VFVAAGFQRLAHLVYMQRPITPQFFPPLSLEPGLELSTWSPSRRQLFHDAIAASYEDTLDCPGLLGLRDVDDVIAGHMATGEFQPALWLALHQGRRPVGVLLLNLVLQRQNMELVYLGLAKPWRGKGLGRRLVQHALVLAQEHHVGHLVLAVDELNSAALRLYRSMGFSATVRKLALVKPLGR